MAAKSPNVVLDEIVKVGEVKDVMLLRKAAASFTSITVKGYVGHRFARLRRLRRTRRRRGPRSRTDAARDGVFADDERRVQSVSDRFRCKEAREVARHRKTAKGDFEEKVGEVAKRSRSRDFSASETQVQTNDTTNEGDAREKTFEFCGLGQEHASVGREPSRSTVRLRRVPTFGHKFFRPPCERYADAKKDQAAMPTENPGPSALEVHEGASERCFSRRQNNRH